MGTTQPNDTWDLCDTWIRTWTDVCVCYKDGALAPDRNRHESSCCSEVPFSSAKAWHRALEIQSWATNKRHSGADNSREGQMDSTRFGTVLAAPEQRGRTCAPHPWRLPRLAVQAAWGDWLVQWSALQGVILKAIFLTVQPSKCKGSEEAYIFLQFSF